MLKLLTLCLVVSLNFLNAEPAKILPLAEKGMISSFALHEGHLFAAGERGHFFEWKNGLKQLPFPENYMITSLSFSGPNLWAVGYNEMIYVKKDQDWIKKSKDERADAVLFSIHFTSEKNGLAVGSFGTALATRDGDVWNTLQLEVEDAHLYQVKSDQKGNFYVSGEFGTLLKLSPELKIEKKFTTQDSVKPTYFGLEIIDEDEFLAYGLSGRIMHFKGDTVTKIDSPRKYSLYASLKKEKDILLFGAEGTILLFRDGVIKDKSFEENAAIIDAVIFQEKVMMGTLRGVREISLKEILE